MATPPPPQGQPPHHPYQGPYGHQQPYPPQQPGMPPGPQGGWPAPPPKPGMSTGAKVGIGCGAAAGALVLMAGCGAVLGVLGDEDADRVRQSRATASAAPSAPSQAGSAPAKVQQKEESLPVTLTAKKVRFKPTALHEDADYTAIRVTVVNNTDDKVSVNPLYFEVTDTSGAKHSAEVFGAEDNLQAVELYKGEKATGTITIKGKVTPAKVYFRKDGFGTTYSAPVR
ncbi:DUF4352 domain-containing protein [Streptomyces sp. NPDC101132]|uniref:DUF4352 domain-containing protein n=1 Tax=Streptomyces sp. NPDC101132 TaxID=3366110 RepID=UPI003809B94A